MKHLIRTILHKPHVVVIEIKHFIWRILLKNRDFTIISNNCWGGTIYQYLKLPYKTPTVGLIIFPRDYVRFCKNIRFYMEQELVFINIKQSKHYNQLTSNGQKTYDFPVAKCGDIEIYFMHYNTEDEARDKWNRRKQRINYQKIIFKFSERDLCTPNDIRNFTNIVGEKIVFTKNRYENIQQAIFVPELNQVDAIGISEVGVTLKYCNIIKLLNNILDD